MSMIEANWRKVRVDKGDVYTIKIYNNTIRSKMTKRSLKLSFSPIFTPFLPKLLVLVIKTQFLEACNFQKNEQFLRPNLFSKPKNFFSKGGSLIQKTALNSKILQIISPPAPSDIIIHFF